MFVRCLTGHQTYHRPGLLVRHGPTLGKFSARQTKRVGECRHQRHSFGRQLSTEVQLIQRQSFQLFFRDDRPFSWSVRDRQRQQHRQRCLHPAPRILAFPAFLAFLAFPVVFVALSTAFKHTCGSCCMKPLWERGVQRCLFRLCRGHLFRCFPFCMVSTELLKPCFGVVAWWIMREVAFLAPSALARWHPVKVVPVIASEFQADGVACFVDEGMQPCPCRRIRAAAWVSSSCCCVFFIHIIHWRDKVICLLLLLIHKIHWIDKVIFS